MGVNGGGDCDERAVLETVTESDRLYVMDRGDAKFALLHKIVAAQNSYVCRQRDHSTRETIEQRSRNNDAQLDEIISDEIVRFSPSSGGSCPDHVIRVVCIRSHPRTSRGKYRGGSSGVDSDGILRIGTNLLDVPAEVVGLVFSHRWSIEISFGSSNISWAVATRVSHNQNGIEIQTYCAIMACLLIALWTGKKPTLRTEEMICFYFCRMADEDELLQHLEKLKSHNA